MALEIHGTSDQGSPNMARFEDCRTAERAIHTVLVGDRHRPDKEWFRCDQGRFRDIALKTPGAI